MTTSRSVLLISVIALILLAFVPAVSAEVLYDEEISFYEFTGGETYAEAVRGGTGPSGFESLHIHNVENKQDISYIVLEIFTGNYLQPEGVLEYTYTQNGITKDIIRYTEYNRNILGQVTSVRYTYFPQDWDVGTLTGSFTLPTGPSKFILYSDGGDKASHYIYTGDDVAHLGGNVARNYKITLVSGIDFHNRIKIESTDNDNALKIDLKRTVYGKTSPSTLKIYAGDDVIQTDYSSYDRTFNVLKRGITKITVEAGDKEFVYPIADSEDPITQPVLRTGTVTMTDHNGTTISGFDVRAVNYYTGEEYTISTDSDVAVITLPMDRTVEIRNPQTGVYEEAPIGYYRFFGYKDGYKMLNEEGIKVSVMPEKYGSYKLCDILVSSDTGPLTGKHQFQLRSWSDNSILQTGTISAKSRTTGIWYNTTVVDGLATLILPYDTSDAISEHAGHYYVYATSPGYEDIDYGVQIAVYPHTVSEIRSIHLYPIGGVPTPGNVTLRIQAISETGQSVPNAEIFIAGVLGAGQDVWDTYTTGWSGFIEVSVPGNSTYDIVARGAGYYDSSRRIEVFTEDPPIIEMYLYLSGAPTVEPTTEPTGWVTGPPTTQPTGGIPDEDDDSDGFMMQSVRGIANLFGVSFGTGKTILGMLLALGIGTATAKHLKGGAQEFGMGMLGGVVLGVLIGLLPIWVLVLLVLIVGLWIGQRYMSGGES